LKTHYRGRNAAPGYHCAGKIIVEGRGCYCLNVGGVQIDEAFARAFLTAIEPAKLTATLAAAERLEADTEATLKQWRQAAERAAYEAKRAERRYRAVDPDNRLVARGLEREWEQRLADMQAANEDLARRLEQRPRVLGQDERDHLLTLGADLAAVWDAPTTTPRDQKELLHALIEEVILSVDRSESAAHLTIRWKGGALTDVDVPLAQDPRQYEPMRRHWTWCAASPRFTRTPSSRAFSIDRAERPLAATDSRPTVSRVYGPTGAYLVSSASRRLSKATL
jgi:hypothetical protein